MPEALGKSVLRRSSLEAMRALSQERLKALSSSVAENLFSLDEFKSAKVLESYAAKADEVQTEAIIRRAVELGKRVIVPVVDSSSPLLTFSEIKGYDELSTGRFGIPEPRRGQARPVSLDEADLALVPLVAWDERGNRLGHGKGYFDRALAASGSKITTAGLGLESQRVASIPAEPHDYPLGVVVTETRVVRCTRSGRS